MTLQSPSLARPELAPSAVSVDEVPLLGGLFASGRLERVARLRPITGLIERELGEIAASARSLPQKVNAVLAACLERVGEVAADEALTAALCVADRRYLMLNLASRIAGDLCWLTPTCVSCKAPFDVRVARSELPVKPASERFPFADVEVSGTWVRLRVATGADQLEIAAFREELARLELLRRCIVSVSGKPAPAEFAEHLSESDIELLDAALDDVSPDVGTLLDAHCPECGERQTVALDPYQHDFFASGEVYEDIHALASAYHWGESEILGLPRERRRLYLRLIERSRGLYS